MLDATNTTTLLLGVVAGIVPTVGLLFKMLIAEKDARINYLEEENRDLRHIAVGGVTNTGQALVVAKQRGSS